MSRKTNKINEWEKLQIQKIRLKADADSRIRALDGHIDYLQDNLGHLLMGSAVASVQSKMPPFIQSLFPLFAGGSGSEKDQQSQYSAQQSSKAGAVVNQIIELIPLFFRGTKSIIIAFILKKAKDLIFSKKKKS